jgi:hypothetical protein
MHAARSFFPETGASMFDYAKMKKKRFKDRDEVRAIDAQRKAHIAAQNAPKTAPTAATYVTADEAADHLSRMANEAQPAAAATEFALAAASKLISANAETTSPTETATAASLEVPANWRDLNWPQTRDLATKIAGREPNSRAEARALIAAHANKG